VNTLNKKGFGDSDVSTLNPEPGVLKSTRRSIRIFEFFDRLFVKFEIHHDAPGMLASHDAITLADFDLPLRGNGIPGSGPSNQRYKRTAVTDAGTEPFVSAEVPFVDCYLGLLALAFELFLFLLGIAHHLIQLLLLRF
jgi:hypothetical protein